MIHENSNNYALHLQIEVLILFLLFSITAHQLSLEHTRSILILYNFTYSYLKSNIINMAVDTINKRSWALTQYALREGLPATHFSSI